jgi:hypothetical protein
MFPPVGSVPATVGSMTALEYLNLRFNYIDGAIPDTIGCLTRLTFLSLGENFFSGMCVGQHSSVNGSLPAVSRSYRYFSILIC